MDQISIVKRNFQEAIALREQILENEELHLKIKRLSEEIVKLFENDGKLLFCGNGGSASDAQHLAAEFSGRYYYDRPPLYSEALHINTSYLTAVGNDYSFEQIYARMVEAMGKKNDILIGLSTSGNSLNIVNALAKAKQLGMFTAAFTGSGGGKVKEHCDLLIEIPSSNTPRIQECHMLIGHSICEYVEKSLFPIKGK
ncbi:D-sedoheptulose-7-phosphate isomerase [Portibacter marinus]|uniref:D-sedoheptulose-7-phosphate isomerase n=1 Tax=Portibacter marinus TaxID=2898660 RepID=UPI001F24DDB7|nr:D-sedoheptulose 7-phosphate isomerase [Portibacter marinus]